jgi:hypothetical protein
VDGGVTWDQVVWAVAALSGFATIVGAFFSVRFRGQETQRLLDRHINEYSKETIDLRSYLHKKLDRIADDVGSLKAWRERERGAADVRKQIHDRTPVQPIDTAPTGEWER